MQAEFCEVPDVNFLQGKYAFRITPVFYIVSDCHKRCFLYVIFDLSLAWHLLLEESRRPPMAGTPKERGHYSIACGVLIIKIYFSSVVEQTWRSYLSKLKKGILKEKIKIVHQGPS
jgi:hypothetical protein